MSIPCCLLQNVYICLHCFSVSCPVRLFIVGNICRICLRKSAFVFLCKHQRWWCVIVAVISIFHVTCTLHFFSDTVFNACRVARYLGISFLCWIRLLNLGIILWLDTACWRYEVRTVILCIPRTRIHCFSVVSDCAGSAALHCVSAILNVYTRRKWCIVHPKGRPCWGQGCS
jgi:hypothetical protein